MLHGAFEPIETVGSESENELAKQQRKRVKFLHSLQTSILPIITSPCLWNLPIIADIPMNPLSPQHPSEFSATSRVALRGNAFFSCLLLEIIGVLTTLLDQETHSFLSVVLLSIVEKASSRNVPLVQWTAASVLEQIVTACRYDNISDLINQSMPFLMSGLVGRLRIPGGRLVPGYDELEGVIAVSGVVRYVLKTTLSGAITEEASIDTIANISHVVKAVSVLMERFDHLIVQKLVAEPQLLELAHLCQECFSFLLSCYGASSETIYTYRMRANGEDAEEEDSKKLWWNLLSPFRVTVAENGVDACVRQESKSINNTSDRFAATTGPVSGQPKEPAITSEEIDFVSRLMARCYYFLSNPSLRVKISSCDALIAGFRFLGFVAWSQKVSQRKQAIVFYIAISAQNPPPAYPFQDSTDDSSKIRTSILREVGTAWPLVKTRLTATSNQIAALGKAKFVLILQQGVENMSLPHDDVGKVRIFHAKLITLISSMGEGSGDFIASRFQNDVWPIMATQLGFLIETHSETSNPRDDKKSKFRFDMEAQTIHRKSWHDSERFLILAMMDCVHRLFSLEECGQSLSGLVSQIGTVLLPFLDDGDAAIVEEASHALKAMFSVDCDALWRPLLQLAGQPFPPCHLRRPLSTTSSELIPSSFPTGRLAEKARELIAYIESLPEQDLF